MSERVSARLPNDLADKLEDRVAVSTRTKTEVVRAALRDHLPASDNDARDELDDDARRAHEVLVDMVGAGGVVSIEPATTEIAAELNRPKESIRRSCLIPLERADAIDVRTRINDVHIVVRDR